MAEGQVAFGFARGAFLVVTGIALLVTAFGIWVLVIPGSLVGLFFVGIGLLATIGALMRVVDGRPQIVVRLEGVFVRSLDATIPWDAVTDVSVGEIKIVSRYGPDKKRFVLLRLKDPATLAARLGRPLPLYRRAKDDTIDALGGPITVLMSMGEVVPDVLKVETDDLDVDAEVVARAILDRMPGRRSAPRKESAPVPSLAPRSEPRTAASSGPAYFPAPSSKTRDSEK